MIGKRPPTNVPEITAVVRVVGATVGSAFQWTKHSFIAVCKFVLQIPKQMAPVAASNGATTCWIGGVSGGTRGRTRRLRDTLRKYYINNNLADDRVRFIVLLFTFILIMQSLNRYGSHWFCISSWSGYTSSSVASMLQFTSSLWLCLHAVIFEQVWSCCQTRWIHWMLLSMIQRPRFQTKEQTRIGDSVHCLVFKSLSLVSFWQTR